MHPAEDQYIAAVAHASRYLDAYAHRTGYLVYRPDIEPAPIAILQWIKAHAEELDSRTLQLCGHGGFTQPLFIYGNEPNIARCARCDVERGAELNRASAGQLLDCHLCGIPESVDRLSVCVFNVAAVVVRAFACDSCLTAPNPFVKLAQPE